MVADLARSVPWGVNRKDVQVSYFESFFIKHRLPGPLLDLDSEFFFRMHMDRDFWEEGTKLLQPRDMIKVSVGEQDARELERVIHDPAKWLGDVGLRIHEGRAAGAPVLDDVDKVLLIPDLKLTDGSLRLTSDCLGGVPGCGYGVGGRIGAHSFVII